MARYRKKPVVIEARQWREPPDYQGAPPGYQSEPLLEGVYAEYLHHTAGPSFARWDFYVITVHGQRAWLADGDWILPEPDGKHFYPCKPDIFEATYEKVEEVSLAAVMQQEAGERKNKDG